MVFCLFVFVVVVFLRLTEIRPEMHSMAKMAYFPKMTINGQIVNKHSNVMANGPF